MKPQSPSKPFALIEFEPLGNEAFQRRSERARMRFGSSTVTLYTIKEDVLPALQSGRMKACLVERVTRQGRYVDKRGPALALACFAGVWYLTASTVERESNHE